MNIPVEELSNGTIIQIATELGCDIPYPDMPMNKYMEVITDDFKKKYEEEQERVGEEIHILFDKYIDDLIEWLYNNYDWDCRLGAGGVVTNLDQIYIILSSPLSLSY